MTGAANYRMNRSNVVLLAKHLAVDTLGSFLYFPFWWYSRGLVLAARGSYGLVGQAAASFGFKHWIGNLFKPMYGATDWQGVLISFFMRCLAIIWYTFLLTVLLVLATTLFAAYLVLPVVAVLGLWTQVTGLTYQLPY